MPEVVVLAEALAVISGDDDEGFVGSRRDSDRVEQSAEMVIHVPDLGIVARHDPRIRRPRLGIEAL